jgi:hypothetical protein
MPTIPKLRRRKLLLTAGKDNFELNHLVGLNCHTKHTFQTFSSLG